MDEVLNKILGKVEDKFSPASIFLYGSRARSDFETMKLAYCF